MWFKVMIFGGICLNKILGTTGHCVDIHSQIISQGLHYVPGPNSCTLCICDKGGPKWCKSVLCSQPQNCKSFQRGNSCCEFKCLDDILTASDTYKDTYDLALRLIASAVFIILTISLLFFIVHRFRRHKLRVQQNRQLNEDQRSLNSIGYITGSLGYLPGNIGYLGSGTNDLELHYEESNGHYSLWKPPENYFPRGEAPPPYEEAIRCSQIDTNVITSQSIITNTPAVCTQSNEIRSNQHQPTTMQCRHQHLTNRTNINQEYANITIETVNPQHTHPLIKIENIKPLTNSMQVDTQNNCVTITTQEKELKTTSSKKSKSYENIITNRKGDNSHTSSEQKVINHKSQIFTDRNRSNIDKNNLKSQKYENVMIKNSASREMHNIRKLDKTHTDKETKNEVCYENINPCYENTAHRTIPFMPEYQTKHQSYVKESKSKENIIPPESGIIKNLNAVDLAERLETNIKNIPFLKNSMDMPLHRTLPKNLKELTISVSSNSEYIPSNVFKQFETNTLLHRSLPKQLSNRDTVLSVNLLKSQINLTENLSREMSPYKMVKNEPASSSSSSMSHVGFLESKVEDKGKNKDDERSFISYQYLSSQDEDDYRSECENCKSSEITNLEDEEGDVFNETMTLQRRPEISEEVPYYRTSLTLPTQIRKPRAVTPNASRNGWFMAMQETSSSEESD